MMPAAEQVYFPAFDKVFFSLSPQLQQRIESRIDEMGLHLETFPHYRITGSGDFRLRIGDYRVIYNFDRLNRVLYLWNLGHSSEIYRSR